MSCHYMLRSPSWP